MEKNDKINQLLAGIMCEFNSQYACFEQVRLINPTKSRNIKYFDEYTTEVAGKLEELYERICDFSNDADINTEEGVVFNNAILSNIRGENSEHDELIEQEGE